MQQPPSVTSKIEHVLFDLTCCINDLHLLQNDLSITDIDQAKQHFKQLCDTIHEKQRQRIRALYTVI